jgi:hypothetical protein
MRSNHLGGVRSGGGGALWSLWYQLEAMCGLVTRGLGQRPAASHARLLLSAICYYLLAAVLLPATATAAVRHSSLAPW